MAGPPSKTPARTRRRYASPRRSEQAAQTRAAVIGAAARSFGEKGWSGTGIRDVARAAGVAVETIYSTFGSKVELLRAALDVAVVGDSEPISVRDRPAFRELGRGPMADRARASARLVREINERTYGIGMALREAAPSDGELAKHLAEGEERRRSDVGEGARLVAGRPISDTERDGLWAVVSMEVYDLLVHRAGWSARRYERWLTETMVRLLTPVEEQS